MTVCTRKDGTPVLSEAEWVGDRDILYHNVYQRMKYSEARQQLLADAESEKSLVDEKRDPSELAEDFRSLVVAGVSRDPRTKQSRGPRSGAGSAFE